MGNTKKRRLQFPDTASGEHEHASVLAGHLTELYRQRRFTDFEIVCCGRSFLVHACVIICRSRYFQSLLQSGMLDSVERRVELDTMNPNVIETIVESLYTGVLSNIDADNVSDLLEASRQLQVPHAEGQCRAWILAHRDQSKAQSPGREAEAPVVEWHIAASTGALSLPQAHLVEIIRDDVWRSVLAHYNGGAANPVLHAEDVVKKYWQE